MTTKAWQTAIQGLGPKETEMLLQTQLENIR